MISCGVLVDDCAQHLRAILGVMRLKVEDLSLRTYELGISTRRDDQNYKHMLRMIQEVVIDFVVDEDGEGCWKIGHALRIVLAPTSRLFMY
jgi:hypothetical protein